MAADAGETCGGHLRCYAADVVVRLLSGVLVYGNRLVILILFHGFREC